MNFKCAGAKIQKCCISWKLIPCLSDNTRCKKGQESLLGTTEFGSCWIAVHFLKSNAWALIFLENKLVEQDLIGCRVLGVTGPFVSGEISALGQSERGNLKQIKVRFWWSRSRPSRCRWRLKNQYHSCVCLSILWNITSPTCWARSHPPTGLDPLTHWATRPPPPPNGPDLPPLGQSPPTHWARPQPTRPDDQTPPPQSGFPTSCHVFWYFACVAQTPSGRSGLRGGGTTASFPGGPYVEQLRMKFWSVSVTVCAFFDFRTFCVFSGVPSKT